MDDNIQIVGLREYVLSHGELSHQQPRGEFKSNNIPFFKSDYKQGVLDRYKGTSVLYHKGVLCGQSENGELLIQKAASYYGASNLTVFHVPEKEDGLENSVLKMP